MSDNKGDFEFLKEIEEYEQQQKEEKADDVKVFEWDDEIKDDGIQEESPSVASCEVSKKDPGKATTPAQTEPKQTTDETLTAEKAYLEKTSRKTAVDTLRCNINTIQQGFYHVWKTGFEKLDNMLDGGFHDKQLIVLGAISSLGKTSLALQIADNVARNGQDVLIFSLEMGSDELLSKSISRETYFLSCGNTASEKTKRKYRLTTQDIMRGNVGDLGTPQRAFFEEALESVEKTNEHVFYYIGKNDVDVDLIRNTVELHQRIRKKSPVDKKPLVIIDYLQILQATEQSQKKRLDKRNMTDSDVTSLKLLARDLEIPVVVISAFNRDSYINPVSSSSFKESSGIEYTADVLLGMQYYGMEYAEHWYKPKGGMGKARKVFESKKFHECRVRSLFNEMDEADERKLELKVLKNRNGKKGLAYLKFQAPFNCFEEFEPSPQDKKVYDFDDVQEETDSPFDDGEGEGDIITL